MIEYVAPFLTRMDERALPAYQTFMRNQRLFVSNRYHRFFISEGHESPGVKLLRYILQFIDTEELDSHISNYDRYLYCVRYVFDNILDIFDRTQRGRGYKNLFFRHGESIYTEEFLIPTSNISSLSYLPMHSEKWEDWKDVRVLRLWDHDSDEYSVNLMNDRLRFEHRPPTYAIETLDIVALIFKYYIWNKTQRSKEPQLELAMHIPRQLFVHKYVICDLVWDETDVWLINTINKVLHCENEHLGDEFISRNLRENNQQWGWVAMTSREAFDSLYQVVRQTRGSVRPESILSSKILTRGSLMDRIDMCDREVEFPNFRQYKYLSWLRDYKMIDIILQLYKYRPDLPIGARMKLYLKRDLSRDIVRCVWNTCQSTSLKEKIKNDMQSLVDTL